MRNVRAYAWLLLKNVWPTLTGVEAVVSVVAILAALLGVGLSWLDAIPDALPAWVIPGVSVTLVFFLSGLRVWRDDQKRWEEERSQWRTDREAWEVERAGWQAERSSGIRELDRVISELESEQAGRGEAQQSLAFWLAAELEEDLASGRLTPSDWSSTSYKGLTARELSRLLGRLRVHGIVEVTHRVEERDRGYPYTVGIFISRISALAWCSESIGDGLRRTSSRDSRTLAPSQEPPAQVA